MRRYSTSRLFGSSALLMALPLALPLGILGCSGGGGSSSGSSASTSAAVASTTSSLPAGAQAGTTATIPREVGLEVSVVLVSMYQDPDLNSTQVGQAAQGQAYVHLEQQGAWHKVQFNADAAWIQNSQINQSTKDVRRVTANTLNVRSGPGTTYRQVGQLAKDQLVVESQAQGDWREISFDGQLAWVHGAYLQGSGVAAPASRPTSTAGFIQLAASGDGFYAYSGPGERWGLPQLIYGVERAGARWKQTGFPRAGVGHISLEAGGAFAPHASHRLGKNLDVRPVRTSGEAPVTISQSAYSRSRTQQLIDLMKVETQARSVLFNDSGVSGVSYYAGHDNHFHLSIP